MVNILQSDLLDGYYLDTVEVFIMYQIPLDRRPSSFYNYNVNFVRVQYYM